MKIRNKIFLSILVVAVIPLVAVLYYVNSIYSENYDIRLAENRKLAKEGVNIAFESFLEKLEWISNDYFDQDVQNILMRDMSTLTEKLECETQLNTISTVKLDLCDVIESVDQIWVKTCDGVYLRVHRNYISGVDLDMSLLPSIRDSYKNQMLYRYEQEEGDNMLVYVRDIKEISNPGNYLATIYICFEESVISEQFLEFCDTFASEVTIENTQDYVLYQSTGMSSISSTDLENEYRKETMHLQNFGLNINYYENIEKEREPIVALQSTVIVILLSSFLIVFLISVLVSSSLVRPIIALTKQVKKIEEGDYQSKVSVKGGKELSNLGSAFNVMGDRIHNLINEGYKKEIAKNEAIIASLTEQINPHFLYNTLDMLKSMAELEDMYEISELIKAMAHTYRYTTKTNQLEVTVTQEVEHLKNYMCIMQVRFGNKITFDINVDESCEQNQMIKLCLQPLVENAIAHGRGSSGKVLDIHVGVITHNGLMRVLVEDTGKGMECQVLEELKQALREGTSPISTNRGEHCGVGLHNINQRIQLYYGEEYCLNIESELNVGTKIWMDFPIERI